MGTSWTDVPAFLGMGYMGKLIAIWVSGWGLPSLPSVCRWTSAGTQSACHSLVWLWFTLMLTPLPFMLKVARMMEIGIMTYGF